MTLLASTTPTSVVLDSFHQVGSASIMEKEDALPHTPKRSGAELIRSGASLRDAVRKTLPHVMDEKA